jgi:predicted NAD/FAD-binding protein
LHLAELARQLDHTVNLLRDADLEAVQARHAADVAESTAYLTAEGSVEMRKHRARLATDKLEEKALQSEAVVRYLRQKINALGVRVEVGRSMGAALRQELQTLPYDQQP